MRLVSFKIILKKEDFSVIKINWENKVNNIQEIQQILNIGFDSMVFIDDYLVKEN